MGDFDESFLGLPTIVCQFITAFVHNYINIVITEIHYCRYVILNPTRHRIYNIGDVVDLSVTSIGVKKKIFFSILPKQTVWSPLG